MIFFYYESKFKFFFSVGRGGGGGEGGRPRVSDFFSKNPGEGVWWEVVGEGG